ncbi:MULTISPECIES: hypothetical protein [Aliagarivorans]|nr:MULTISPECIES: hypothetical protein [Aliagarivorans]
MFSHLQWGVIAVLLVLAIATSKIREFGEADDRGFLRQSISTYQSSS